MIPFVLPLEVNASRSIEPPCESTPVSMLLIVKPLPFSSPALTNSTPLPRFPAPARVAEELTVITPPSE